MTEVVSLRALTVEIFGVERAGILLRFGTAVLGSSREVGTHTYARAHKQNI